MSTKWLKEEGYYNDHYDLSTIEECLRFIDSWRKICLENHSNEKLMKLSEEEKQKAFSIGLNMELFIIKGERYQKKSSVIHEWMDADRKRDEFLQNAQEPANIRCDHCSGRMSVILKESYELSKKHLRVLFFFHCLDCKKRKGYFDNGEAFKSKPEICPQCNKVIKSSITEQGRTLICAKNCVSCGYEVKEIEDLDKSQAQRIDKEEKVF